MTDKQKTKLFTWAQFVVGVFLVCAMLYLHVYVKELSPFIWLIPGALLKVGFDQYSKGK